MNGGLPRVPKTMETERLRLQAMNPKDAAAVYAGVQESMTALSRWMPWARPDETVDDTRIHLREANAHFTRLEEFSFTLWRKADDEFLGCCGIHRIDWSVPRFEIGYWLRTSMEGQGYMTETVNFLTAFLFNEQAANRIEIRCDAENRPSAAVAERCGFTLEARLRHERRNTSGALADTLIYVKFPET